MSAFIKRRDVIRLLGGAATVPLLVPHVARAQQPSMPVIGHVTTPSAIPERMGAFRRGLREAGYIEGQNVAVVAWSTDQNDRLPALMEDLIRRQTAVLVVQGNYATLAAMAATSKIPIVFSGGFDPVELGIVTSLSQPGGNITGASFFSNALEPKRLGLIRLLAPRADTIAALVNPDNASAKAQIRGLTDAASSVGLKLVMLNARNEREFDPAIADAVRQNAGALVVGTDGFFTAWREHLLDLVVHHRIPAIYPSRQFTQAGGLMSYTANQLDADHQSGVYAGRILKGEKPGDLPVVLPTRFELVINLKTAKTQGLIIPDGLLLAADEVIE